MLPESWSWSVEVAFRMSVNENLINVADHFKPSIDGIDRLSIKW